MRPAKQLRTFLSYYICDACPLEWTDQMNVIQFSYCPCCDEKVEPYDSVAILEDVEEEEF